MRDQIQNRRAQVQVTAIAVAFTAALLVLLATTIADAGNRGPRGHRGPQGYRGEQGPAGESAPGLLKQNIAIAWQNGDYNGRDARAFVAPGIGSGEVRCSPDRQWIRFWPSDLNADTALWTVRLQRPSSRGDSGDQTESVVRTARRGYDTDPNNSGRDYNESMSVHLNGADPTSTGSFIGQISSAGDHFTPGGPGPRSTSFQLSWHWNFVDGSPRCFIAGSFTTGT